LVQVLMNLQCALFAAALTMLTAVRVDAQSETVVDNGFFEARIRPVLVKHCYACHSSKMPAPKGQLVLDTKAGLLKGGSRGPAVVPGKPAESMLLGAIDGSDPFMVMPPTGKLPDPVIADFERWIAGGAPDPRTEETTKPPQAPAHSVDEKALRELRRRVSVGPGNGLLKKEGDGGGLVSAKPQHSQPQTRERST
jgi:hypothetical protein